MNTINIDEMKAAVENLADRTNRTQHVEVIFKIMYLSSTGRIKAEWQAYVDGTNYTIGVTREEAISKLNLSQDNFIQKAEELEAQAANLRKLAVQS